MRRTRAPGAGNTRELRVMDVLAEEGWLCASRRHIGGAGDVLAIRSYVDIGSAKGEGIDARLIEVKSTAGGPWERFGPADRQALVETAERHGAEAWLYWWPPRKPLQRIRSSAFPKSHKALVEIEP
jgi:hypothetical protein